MALTMRAGLMNVKVMNGGRGVSVWFHDIINDKACSLPINFFKEADSTYRFFAFPSAVLATILWRITFLPLFLPLLTLTTYVLEQT